jgi:hypothetical protein
MVIIEWASSQPSARQFILGYSEELTIQAMLCVMCCVTGQLTNHAARINLAVSLFLLNSLRVYIDLNLSAVST